MCCSHCFFRNSNTTHTCCLTFLILLSNGFRKQGISDYTLNSLAYNEVTHGAWNVAPDLTRSASTHFLSRNFEEWLFDKLLWYRILQWHLRFFYLCHCNRETTAREEVSTERRDWVLEKQKTRTLSTVSLKSGGRQNMLDHVLSLLVISANRKVWDCFGDYRMGIYSNYASLLKKSCFAWVISPLFT